MLTDGFYAEVTLSYDGIVATRTWRSAIRDRQPSTDPNVEVGCARRSSARPRKVLQRRNGSNCCFGPSGLNPPAWMNGQTRCSTADGPVRRAELQLGGTRATRNRQEPLYQQISPYAHLISGGKATVAKMFVNNATGQRGLVCQYDVVCFDEVSGISFDQKDGVNIMKGYMASGQFSRGKENIRADGGIVMVGNFDVDVRATTAYRPSAESATAGNAQRYSVHGSAARLCSRAGTSRK